MSSFEDAIMQAIVNQFFEERVVQDQYGTMRSVGVPTQLAASKMFELKKDEILKAVMEKVDINMLADAIVNNLVKELSYDSFFKRTMNEGLEAKITHAIIEKIAERKATELMAKDQAA